MRISEFGGFFFLPEYIGFALSRFQAPSQLYILLAPEEDSTLLLIAPATLTHILSVLNTPTSKQEKVGT